MYVYEDQLYVVLFVQKSVMEILNDYDWKLHTY